MTDAATGVSENLMDADVSNGASDSPTSGSSLLSRKGLFGKSGVLNQTLETGITVEKEVLKPDSDKTNGDGNDGEEANTSGSGSGSALTIASAEVTKEEGDEDSSPGEIADEKEEKSDPQPSTEEPSAEPGNSQSQEVVQEEEKEDANAQNAVQDHTAEHNEEESGDKKDIGKHYLEGEEITKEKTENQDEHEDAEEEHKEAETDNSDQTGVDQAKDDVNDDGEEADVSGIDEVEEKVTEPEPIVEDPEPTIDTLPASVEEEVCVKKIISMDTDDVDQDQNGETIASNADDNENSPDQMEITEVTAEEDGKEEEKEDDKEQPADEVPIVEEPDAAESECMEEGDNNESTRESENEATEENVVIEEMESDAVEKTDEAAAPEKEGEDGDKKDAENDEEKEDDEAPKRRSSSRRSIPVVPVEKKPTTRAKTTPAKKTPSKRRADEEKADDEEKPEVAEETGDSKEDIEEKEETTTEPRSLRSRGRRSNVVETPKTEERTPSRKRGKTVKSAKKDVAAEAEDENEQDSDKGKEREKTEDMDAEPTRCSLRSRVTKTPAKQESPAPKSTNRRGRSAKKEDNTIVKKEAEGEGNTEPETPRRTRKAPTTPSATKTNSAKISSAKKGKDEDHDPYDIETEMERHPEPLKNIQMEVQSFGEVKYAKTSSGKYERTEKTAESRVANLAELAPRTKQRKSLADLTPGRKKASPTATTGVRTAPQPSRGGRKVKPESEEADKEEEPMEVEDTSDVQASDKKAKKSAETPKTSGSARKRRASVQTPVVAKRLHVEVPQLNGEDLLAVDHPQDEHAAYEAGARVYAMFDGLFYPAVVVSRDGLGRYKVSFVEDGVVKDVPPAGVIPLRALDHDKECFYSDGSQKDRVAVKVLKAPDSKHASSWQEAVFELEQLDDDGDSTGKKLKSVWTNLALSKEDWRDYINKKSREATDVIADNIESTEDRHLRRSKVATPSQSSTPNASKPAPKSAKKATNAVPTPKAKTPAKGGRRKKGTASNSSRANEVDEDGSESAPESSEEQIFAGKLFILTSANRPPGDATANSNTTAFKKKFMTDFISTHGGLVVDDMKEVDEHPEMERFLISDTHYRTHKYLAALVRAMPCVSHEWIYKCLGEKKLVDYKPFLLPSGVSILDEREYPLPKERGVLLRNKRVMVHSNVTPPSKKSMSFEQIWVPMVPQLGGEIVSEMPDEEGKLDILLTDHSASVSLVEKARKIGSAVVSSEWLIQGIIMDRLPDVNAHQKFLHNGGVYT
ncbi:hypothetical protein RB195_005163 [Necator americanus]|uniref:BRCT domain-containing protein n=1 Tax=Necator americanus TaxID=51031 RepID=A0ABR1BLI4_NECAM